MLVLGLGVFVLVALFCPDTLIGRAVKRLLVDLPARALSDLTPKKALLLVAMILFAMAFAQIAPAEFVWIAAGDAATYLEVVAATWMLAASGQARRAVGWLVARVVRLGPVVTARVLARRGSRPGGARVPRIQRRRPQPPADPGEARGVFGWAWA
jgi:hypothetical protein